MIVRLDSVSPIDFGGLRILDYTADGQTTSSFAVITVPPGVLVPKVRQVLLRGLWHR